MFKTSVVLSFKDDLSNAVCNITMWTTTHVLGKGTRGPTQPYPSVLRNLVDERGWMSRQNFAAPKILEPMGGNRVSSFETL